MSHPPTTTKPFLLPDLGEGLPDAEIVEWFVKEGDVIRLDEPLVSMETAKAVVEVPSPFSGTVVKLHGGPGDVIITGSPLAEFEIDDSLPQRAEAEETGHHHGPPKKTAAAAETEERADSGTVVGAMQSSDEVRQAGMVSAGGVKAMPAVRALARKLGVDLAQVPPSGDGGVITLKDVKAFAEGGARTAPAAPPSPSDSARLPSPPGRGAGGEGPAVPQAPTHLTPAQRRAATAGELRAPALAGGAMPSNWNTAPLPIAQTTTEALRGVRRNMARTMAQAHAEIVPTTLCDDADIHAWWPGQDITARLIRSLVAGARSEPGLNAWFNGTKGEKTVHATVDVGIAVDTPDGLFVSALRGCHAQDAAQLRAGINRLREQVKTRSIPPADLTGYTIMLSNFGVFAGRYATPVIAPPCVAILAAGKLRHELVPVMGGIETHRVIPLSLTFDHRAATGGEAARFLRAVLDDLALPF
jgi:2-oxoisovalerate dehydrogenase E2 component (dihydrolipoyl transacylase)